MIWKLHQYQSRPNRKNNQWDRNFDVNKPEKKKRQNNKREWIKPCDTEYTIKKSNIWNVEIAEREDQKKRIEILFKEIMIENFPDLRRD